MLIHNDTADMWSGGGGVSMGSAVFDTSTRTTLVHQPQIVLHVAMEVPSQNENIR